METRSSFDGSWVSSNREIGSLIVSIVGCRLSVVTTPPPLYSTSLFCFQFHFLFSLHTFLVQLLVWFPFSFFENLSSHFLNTSFLPFFFHLFILHFPSFLFLFIFFTASFVINPFVLCYFEETSLDTQHHFFFFQFPIFSFLCVCFPSLWLLF